MTNYPRDEFDRVPEFNTRVGSHHAHGWAQSAAAKGTGSKLRWVVAAAIVVVAVGVLAFFFGPRNLTPVAGTSPSSAASTSASPSTDESATESPSASASETSSEEPTQSSTIDESEVMFGQLVGVYNAANIAGIASAGQNALTEAGFTNITADNWTRSAQTSTVYYTSEAYRTTAQKVAEVLNIDQVLQTTNIPNRVTAVLGADDTLNAQ